MCLDQEYERWLQKVFERVERTELIDVSTRLKDEFVRQISASGEGCMDPVLEYRSQRYEILIVSLSNDGSFFVKI